MFTSVTLTDTGKTPARVDRRTGALELNARTWPHLPPWYQQYILLHETGHIQLNTSNETAANQFAVNRYLTPFRNNPAQLSQAIAEVAEITNPAETQAFDGFTLEAIGQISSGLGNIFNALPAMGVGSKKRREEATNLSFLQITQAAQDRQSKTQYIIIGGVMLLVLIFTYLQFKK